MTMMYYIRIDVISLVRIIYISFVYTIPMSTRKRKAPRTVKKLEEQLRKARSQARNEKVKRVAYEEGVKQGLHLANMARNMQ